MTAGDVARSSILRLPSLPKLQDFFAADPEEPHRLVDPLHRQHVDVSPIGATLHLDIHNRRPRNKQWWMLHAKQGSLRNMKTSAITAKPDPAYNPDMGHPGIHHLRLGRSGIGVKVRK